MVVLDALPGVTDRPPDGRDGTGLAGATGGGAGGSAGATGGSVGHGRHSSTGGSSGMADGDPGGGPEVGPSPAPDMAEPDAPLSANGAACTGAAQCSSGFCVDGICCNSACTGACQACDIASSAGTCSPIADGQDPINECEQQAVSTCGTDGACNGSGACRKYAAGTQCAPGRCTGRHRIRRQHLQRRGRLHRGQHAQLRPQHVHGRLLRPTCTGADDCQSGFFCDSGTCRSKRPNGMACTMAGQCASNHLRRRRLLRHRLHRHLPGLQPVGLGRHLHARSPTGMDPGGECPAAGGQHLRPRRRL